MSRQSQISDYRAALGNGLPILWWQTPMGVPSDTPGGTDQHYRNNHVDYMLRNAQEYGDTHTFAIVFSPGGSHSDVDQHRWRPVCPPLESVSRARRRHPEVAPSPAPRPGWPCRRHTATGSPP